VLATPRDGEDEAGEGLGIEGKKTRELQILFGAIRAISRSGASFFHQRDRTAEVATARMMQERSALRSCICGRLRTTIPDALVRQMPPLRMALRSCLVE